MNTIFQQWQSYEREIVPKEAPAIQREESRRAFYAGAVALFGLVMEATEPADEDECGLLMTRLHDELNQFPNDMRMT